MALKPAAFQACFVRASVDSVVDPARNSIREFTSQPPHRRSPTRLGRRGCRCDGARVNRYSHVMCLPRCQDPGPRATPTERNAGRKRPAGDAGGAPLSHYI
jgi:hypothetical protein